MKKIILLVLAAAAMTFSGCKKELPKAIPDPTPQTGAVETNDVDYAKSLTNALEAKNRDKISLLLGEVIDKAKEAVKEAKNDPETFAKFKEQIPAIQEWLKSHRSEVLSILGEKGRPLVEGLLNLKI